MDNVQWVMVINEQSVRICYPLSIIHYPLSKPWGMQKTTNTFAGEIAWLAGLALITLLTTVFVLDWPLGANTVDIQLYDTYYVFSGWHIRGMLFLSLVVCVYLMKEICHRFRRPIPRTILIGAGLLLAALLWRLNAYEMVQGFSGNYLIFA